MRRLLPLVLLGLLALGPCVTVQSDTYVVVVAPLGGDIPE